MRARVEAAALLVLSACVCGEVPGVQVRMDFTRAQGFWSAPFPSEDLRGGDGRISLAGFPAPGSVRLVDVALRLLDAEARGFAQSGAVFLPLTGPIDAGRLPDILGSATSSARVFLMDVQEDSPTFLQRVPAEIAFSLDGGPYGAPNLLAILPLQGRPLRARTRYAAVVLRGLHAASGELLGVSASMAQLANGDRPEGLSRSAYAEYAAAIGALEKARVEREEIAGLAVFITGDATQELAVVRAAALARPLPTPGAFEAAEVFEDFCVFQSTMSMPVYQEGTPPYASAGGGWVFDAGGAPILQGAEEANVVVTVPRAAMPAAGWPLVVFVRTGGGGERPLVDRGRRAVAGGDAESAGTGPAREFARAGFAGLSVDGPHGGRRNVTHSDEQFLMFNVGNPVALRDNVRQSALELVLAAHVAGNMTLDASSCPGASPSVKFDVSKLAIMGHSMGATIAPLAVAHEPLYRALLLSGAGGSWIENVVHKKKPLEVRPLAEALLGYAEAGRALTVHDPVLTILQWAAEPADPQVYARHVVHEPLAGAAPRHVLMLQGIVDPYIPPPVLSTASRSRSGSTWRAFPTTRWQTWADNRRSRNCSASPAASRSSSRLRGTRARSLPWWPSTSRTGSRTGTRWCSRPTAPSASTGASSLPSRAARRWCPRTMRSTPAREGAARAQRRVGDRPSATSTLRFIPSSPGRMSGVPR